MKSRNTFVRSLHDLGGAAWFGGSLMGAVGLNGAAADVNDPTERTRIAAAGWARWAPVNAVAIGAHLMGGLGLVVANRGRIAHQPGVKANSILKTALTIGAVASTAYSGVLGARIAQAGPIPAEGGTTPSEATPDEITTVMQQQRILQWVTPILTGALLLLGAQQGEQQRPAQQAAALLKSKRRDAA